jgi:hypothetical protein
MTKPPPSPSPRPRSQGLALAGLTGLILGAGAALLCRSARDVLEPRMTKAPPETLRALQEGYGFSQGYP